MNNPSSSPKHTVIVFFFVLPQFNLNYNLAYKEMKPVLALLFLPILGIIFLGGSANAVVDCPDHKSECPDGTTCCLLTAGEYGCCPMPEAMCCNDHLHCCPHGTKCDVQHQQCLENPSGIDGRRRSHPIQRKFAAKVRGSPTSAEETSKNSAVNNDQVMCPDGEHFCPSHTTCCPLDDGGQGVGRQFWRTASGRISTSYGCCQAEQGVCCADHVHCCPQGTECDLKEGKCLEPSGRRTAALGHSPMLRHSTASREETQTPHSTTDANAKSAQPTVPGVRLCGFGGGASKQAVCPSEAKCCRHRNPLNGQKSNGCCPFHDGQCCAHSGHCCPAGFACDSVEGRCVNEQTDGVTMSTEMVPTTKAAKLSHHLGTGLSSSHPKICPDGTVCGSSTDTCCAREKQQGGNIAVAYDCCPMNKANCCTGQFCCPNGYKCMGNGDGQSQGCQRMTVREMIGQLFRSAATGTDGDDN